MTRNSQELASEVDALISASRAELTEELQEIVRMAFERRSQLHVAALAAGQVQPSNVALTEANHVVPAAASRNVLLSPQGRDTSLISSPARARPPSMRNDAGELDVTIAREIVEGVRRGVESGARTPIRPFSLDGVGVVLPGEPDPFAVQGAVREGGRL